MTPVKARASALMHKWTMHTIPLRLAALALSVALASVAFAAEQPSAEEIIGRLRKGHPRLLASDADLRALREKVAAQPKSGEWAANIRKDADQLLPQPPSKYEIPDGKRLLATSRRVLDRSLTLGMAYRLTGDARYRDRLWRELDAAAKFKDWNPSHFLDTAEMTAAFAVGYDWLHAAWTPEQRTVLRKAIVGMGLKQSLDLYRRHRWWAVAEHNWNQVCNGGMTLGALAVADEEPVLAGEILAAAIQSVPRAMRHFAPDGAWGEGPGYWDYATKYNVLMLAALDTALGTDYGLSKIEGFAKAGDFPIHITGPLGKAFNYADAGEGAPGGAQMFWLASKFNNPAFAAARIVRARSSPDALDLLWGAAWLERAPKLESLPLARHFRGAEVVTMRSAWDDPDATFVGFKGGDNAINHGHLDLGSFVLDACGRRWAMDLGGDNYNLPDYFGGKRWDYYRCRAEGQNALIINPGKEPDQDPRATAGITKFQTSPGRSLAIADITAAYAKSATKVRRGIALLGRDVVVQDEVQMKKSGDVMWFMHTAADVTLDGATATLTLDGRKLTARILSPSNATFRVLPAGPLPTSPQPKRQQEKGPGSHGNSKSVRKLAIQLDAVTDLTLAVLLTPDDKAPSPTVQPLEKW